MAKRQPCRITGCGQEFDNSFELSQHIAAGHQVMPDVVATQDLSDPNDPENELPKVLVRTTRKVELCLGGKRYQGTELQIPYHQVDDVRRILKEAYERDGGARILAD